MKCNDCIHSHSICEELGECNFEPVFAHCLAREPPRCENCEYSKDCKFAHSEPINKYSLNAINYLMFHKY